MRFQFTKHYTLDEARSLLPEIRAWLEQLAQLRQRLQLQDKRLAQLLAAGHDAGGDLVNHWVRTVQETRKILCRFQEGQIQIKDVDRGLIDFPAIISGKEVFLCWEKDEDDIEFWHELDTGYAGRERL